MKEYSTIDAIRLYVMKAQTQKALEELYDFLRETKVPELLDQIIILSSNYNDISQSAQLGLGTYQEEKNRINLALLKILTNLEADNRIKVRPNKEKSGGERLDAIERKLEFLLRHVERNDDALFYGFSKSNLWHGLEAASRDQLLQASIIEKEMEQDRFVEAMNLLIDTVVLELETKFFRKFREQFLANPVDRKEFIGALHGMNKDSLYAYLHAEQSLSLHQISEILLQNVFHVEKEDLSTIGQLFFRTFHNSFKVRNQVAVTAFFEKQQLLKLSKTLNNFTQTLIDVVQMKEDVITLLLNLQPTRLRKTGSGNDNASSSTDEAPNQDISTRP